MSLDRLAEAKATPATSERKEWMIALYHLIDTDIDMLIETPEKLVSTLNKIIKQEPDFLTGDSDFDVYLTHIHDALTLHSPKSKLYELITQREKTANLERTRQGETSIPLPAVAEVRAYALSSLREICAEKELKIITDDMPNEVIPYFIPDKQYVFEEIMSLLEIYLKQFGLKSSPGKNLFIILLSRFAGVPDFSLTSVRIGMYRVLREVVQLSDGRTALASVRERMANAFYLHFDADYAVLNQFSRFYNKASPDNETIVHLTTEEDSHTTCMLIKPMIKLLSSSEFRKFVTDFFGNPHILKNVQLYLANEGKNQLTQHHILCVQIDAIGEKYLLNVTSDLLEVALLHAYHITSPARVLQFQPAERYEEFMTNTDFHLDITKEQAEQLVLSINRDFPNAAKIIGHDVLLPKRDPVPVQLISIQYDVATSAAFLEKIRVAIEDIAKNKPELYKKLAFNSSAKYFYEIYNAYSSYSNLSKSLFQLYIAITSRQSTQAIDDANFEVTKALAQIESVYEIESSYTDFKATTKLEIKNLQKRVGLRSTKNSSSEKIEEKIAGETTLQKLQTLSDECKEETPTLSEAILRYSEAVSSSASTAEAKFGLKKAIAEIESKCFSQDQHTLFKSGLKRKIKSVLEKQEIENAHNSSASAMRRKT